MLFVIHRVHPGCNLENKLQDEKQVAGNSVRRLLLLFKQEGQRLGSASDKEEQDRLKELLKT